MVQFLQNKKAEKKPLKIQMVRTRRLELPRAEAH